MWGNGVPFQLPTDLLFYSFKKKRQDMADKDCGADEFKIMKDDQTTFFYVQFKLRSTYKFNMLQYGGFLCTGQIWNGSWQMI